MAEAPAVDPVVPVLGDPEAQEPVVQAAQEVSPARAAEEQAAAPGEREDPRPSTRTSCTSCGPRSWPTRCWHAGRCCRITYRWQCRARGPCPACSRPTCPTCRPPPDPEQVLGQAPDLPPPTSTDLMVWLGPTCPPLDPLECPQACRVSPLMDHPNNGLKAPWGTLHPPPVAPNRSSSHLSPPGDPPRRPPPCPRPPPQSCPPRPSRPASRPSRHP